MTTLSRHKLVESMQHTFNVHGRKNYTIFLHSARKILKSAILHFKKFSSGAKELEKSLILIASTGESIRPAGDFPAGEASTP